jgi:hypothetical protein
MFSSLPAQSPDDEHPASASTEATATAATFSFVDFIYSPLKSSGIAVEVK